MRSGLTHQAASVQSTVRRERPLRKGRLVITSGLGREEASRGSPSTGGGAGGEQAGTSRRSRGAAGCGAAPLWRLAPRPCAPLPVPTPGAPIPRPRAVGHPISSIVRKHRSRSAMLCHSLCHSFGGPITSQALQAPGWRGSGHRLAKRRAPWVPSVGSL